MMINENNTAAGSSSGNDSQDLGVSVLQRHNQIFRHPGSNLVRNHLGQGRFSLAADIYRRYNRSSSSLIRGADFPLVNFFSQNSLSFHSGSEEPLPHHAPRGMNQLHRSVDISPYKPHIGLTGNTIRRTAASFANGDSSVPVYRPKSSNQSSSMPLYSPESSSQSSIMASDSNNLSRMPSASYSHSQAQPIVQRRERGIGDNSFLDNSLTANDINKEHFSGAVQPELDRQGQKRLALNSTESSIARFTFLEHHQADSKTTLSADAVPGLLSVVNPKMGSAFETIAGNQLTSFDAVRPGNTQAQSSIQRAVNRKTGIISQKHPEARDPDAPASVQPGLLSNDGLQPSHTLHFSPPLVTIKRQFSLSSGRRFEGLGIGRKIIGRTAGTLSQQGLAGDKVPASSIARFTHLEHNQAGGKTAAWADSVSGLPPVVNSETGPAFETIAGSQLTSSDAVQPGNTQVQSSLQRVLNRKTGIISRKHSESRDPKTLAGEQPGLFVNDEFRPGHTRHFSFSPVTVNRQFSLSSGRLFEGPGIGRKIIGRNAGTLSQPGFAGDKIPASSIARFTHLEHNQADSRTAARADAVSGLPPVVSPKMGPAFETIAGDQSIPFDAVRPGNAQAQSPIQRALDGNSGVIFQKHSESREDHTLAGEQPRLLVNDGLRPSHAFHFSSPLVTIKRQFSLSSGHRLEGLGIGRKMLGGTAGTLSRQGYAGNKIPASWMAEFSRMEHSNADNKALSIVEAVPEAPAINTQAEPSSKIMGRKPQASSNASAPLWDTRVHYSVQRALERQNSIQADKLPQPDGIGGKSLDLKTDFRNIESGPKRYDEASSSADSISTSGDSLLMRSMGSSSKKVKPLFQVLLNRQLPGTVSRKNISGQHNMPVGYFEADDFSPASGNSFTKGTGSLASEASQHTEPQGKSFYEERALDNAVPLPLVQPLVVQRKAAVHEKKPAAGEVSAYLQRQDIGNLETAAPAASVQNIEAFGSQGGKSDSNSLSADDIVDKVWRKLMRKLAFEQEKMGGGRRWAS